MPPRPLHKADRTWLVELDARLWERHVGHMRANMSGDEWEETYYTEKEGAKIVATEWDHLRALVADHELPVTLGSASFCFGLAISVYDHATPPDKPELLASVSGKHLSDYSYQAGHRNGFDLGWEAFSPIAKTPRNAELLTFYGLEPIGTKGDYGY